MDDRYFETKISDLQRQLIATSKREVEVVETLHQVSQEAAINKNALIIIREKINGASAVFELETPDDMKLKLAIGVLRGIKKIISSLEK